MASDQTEETRLQALKQLKLLDTPTSESFDRITRMASQLFDLPIAAVSLTDSDRQWFKSRVGVDHWEIPRERAPCGEVADTAAPLVIPDLLEHAWYRESILARSGIRFYAGAPLKTREGFCLGAMCVLGIEPRQVTEEEQGALVDLAAMVMAQVELQHAFGRLDSVTGLPNRNQLVEDLEDQARDLPGERRDVLLAEIIDSVRAADAVRVLGAGVFEEAMREAARRLAAALDPSAEIYQVGTAQFAWIAPPPRTQDRNRERLKLHRRLETCLQIASIRVLANPAIGIASIRLGQSTSEDAIRMAQNAVLEARLAGQPIGIYSKSADRDHQRRYQLLTDMRTALSTGQGLSLVYQPRVDLQRGLCLGVEALLRWDHPTFGAVSPGEFIPLVEQTDLAAPLTEWVADTALRQLVAWRRAGLDLNVSINVSATNFDDKAFARGLVSALSRAALPGNALEIEVTESALMRDRPRVEAQLQQLRDAGVVVSIDDFGTGYSSLSYLKSLPADVVKIDRAFVRELASDPKGCTLVQLLVEMSHGLGFKVVAEGVEDETTYDLLRRWGCDEAQGYWISRPITPAALEMWLSQHGGIVEDAA